MKGSPTGARTFAGVRARATGAHGASAAKAALLPRCARLRWLFRLALLAHEANAIGGREMAQRGEKCNATDAHSRLTVRRAQSQTAHQPIDGCATVENVDGWPAKPWEVLLCPALHRTPATSALHS